MAGAFYRNLMLRNPIIPYSAACPIALGAWLACACGEPSASREVPGAAGQGQWLASTTDAATIARGTGAFVYADEAAWVQEFRHYDAEVRDGGEQQLRYLFVGAGVARVQGSTLAEHELTYSTKLLNHYATEFPDKEVIPIVGGRGGVLLNEWSPSDQRKLAAAILERIAAGPDVPGVLVDIEPLGTEHLHLYAELRRLLDQRQKLLWMFAGDEERVVYNPAHVVVLSGYDIGGTPVTPPLYGDRLGRYVRSVFDDLNGFETRIMVAVPAAASAEEFESQSGTCSRSTGYTQEEWLSSALEALCPIRNEDAFVGLTIWGFYGEALENPGGSGCLTHPGRISSDNWIALQRFGDDCSDTTTEQDESR